MLRLLPAVLCVAALSLLAPATYADNIVTFAAQGVTFDSSVLTGDVVIDTTVGTVTSLDLTLSAPDSFTTTTILAQGPLAGFYQVEAGLNATHFMVLGFTTPSLVGFPGGSLCTLQCGSGNSVSPTGQIEGGIEDINFFETLSLTPTTSPVPEPGSTAMVGLAGIALLFAAHQRYLRSRQ